MVCLRRGRGIRLFPGRDRPYFRRRRILHLSKHARKISLAPLESPRAIYLIFIKKDFCASLVYIKFIKFFIRQRFVELWVFPKFIDFIQMPRVLDKRRARDIARAKKKRSRERFRFTKRKKNGQSMRRQSIFYYFLYYYSVREILITIIFLILVCL